MSDVTLVETTAEEFAGRLAEMIPGYARSIADNTGVALSAATAEAERDTTLLLPDGPRTSGHLLRTARVDGTVVGWIWVALPSPHSSGRAWVYEVLVDEPYQRRGHGRAILEAIEAELAGRGVTRLGLNVFGDNDTARRLYDRLGYSVVEWQLSRPSVGIRAAGPPVTLVPLAPSAFERRMASWVTALTTGYGITAEAARQRAWQPFADGQRTEGVSASAVRAGRTEVGWVCYALRPTRRPHPGWLYRLDIDPPFRSRGHGTAAIAAVGAELAGRGVDAVGTAVPGTGPGAMRLAGRLGFTLTAQHMEKNLPGR